MAAFAVTGTTVAPALVDSEAYTLVADLATSRATLTRD